MRFIAKYNWLIPALLFTAAMLAGRMFYTSSLRFFFIPWNLFLAFVPVYFAYKLNEGVVRGVRAVALFSLWLLFFPNSMYIVTDLFHLKQRQNVPLWYDLLILVSAAITGIAMGFASLRQVERFLSARIEARFMRWVLRGLFVLCGYGIYIGRYLRWNSWDIVADPVSLCTDMLHHVIHPYRNKECWAVSLLFGTWMYILYAYFGRTFRRGEQVDTGTNDAQRAGGIVGL
ncbi:DUF1361 domain-containing protein [Nemorincola caseinilytica]|uniref:DUF1361 domain-containing protein n=1 Tax=Nemorincola caseinilytica TaxID=2054315 RepID=A0ABP8NDX8_9BACT